MYKIVLVIDDSNFDRLIAQKLIQLCSFSEKTLLVNSALEGIDFLKGCLPTNTPDIIFLDIKMPDMDGFGFLELFKELPDFITKTSKIFMLSSSLDPDDIIRSRESEYVCDFISKPLTREKLEALNKKDN